MALLASFASAGCARHLPILAASLAPGEPETLVVEFDTCDIFQLGIIPHGSLRIADPVPPGSDPDLDHCWVAKLKDEPLRIQNLGPAGRVYTYRWTFPTRADTPYDGPVPGTGGADAPILHIRSPYNLSRPGRYVLEFQVVGPVCGFRPVVSDLVHLVHVVP